MSDLTVPTDPLAEGPVEPANDIVASFCGHIAMLRPGERATLRRMNISTPARSAGLVTGLLMAAGFESPQKISEDVFRRWSILAHCAGLLSGTGNTSAHSGEWSRGLGQVLSVAGYSENRLMRLTSAKRSALEDQVVRAVRYLAQANAAPVNMRTVRDLLDPDRAESARLTIARGYYAANYVNTAPQGSTK
jgi:hypothetical protein